MESGDAKTRNSVAAASSSQMTASKPSPDKSFPKQEQGKKPSVFMRKLLHKRPISSHRSAMEEEKIEDLKNSTFCYSKASPGEEGCSSSKDASEVENLLSLSLPSFLLEMRPSHVSGGFWLGLPKKFCAKHLPMSDGLVTLVHESGREHEVKYLPGRPAFSGGWKGFSEYHSLEEEDQLFFELIKPCTFKVDIFRKFGSAGVVLNSDFQPEQLASVDAAEIEEEDGNAEMHASENTSDLLLNVSDESSSEVSKGNTFSDKFVELKDFRIIVDGRVIDSEIPEQIRAKYYRLCKAKKGYLHSHFSEGLNSKMAAGAIIEAVDIADAIRASKITTPCDELVKWDKCLKICEYMGMELGFMRSRIRELVALHSEETRMYQTKMNQRAKVDEEVKKDEAKLLKIERAIMRRLDRGLKNVQVPKCNF